jgi:hypothetical protein
MENENWKMENAKWVAGGARSRFPDSDFPFSFSMNRLREERCGLVGKLSSVASRDCVFVERSQRRPDCGVGCAGRHAA